MESQIHGQYIFLGWDQVWSLTEMFGVSEVGEALRPGECLVGLAVLSTGCEETLEVTRLLPVPAGGARGAVLDDVRYDSLGVLIQTCGSYLHHGALL